jgi:hypothetical protein
MTLVQERSDDVNEIPKFIDTGVLIESATLTVAVMQIHTLSTTGVHPSIGGKSCGRCDWLRSS